MLREDKEKVYFLGTFALKRKCQTLPEIYFLQEKDGRPSNFP